MSNMDGVVEAADDFHDAAFDVVVGVILVSSPSHLLRPEPQAN